MTTDELVFDDGRASDDENLRYHLAALDQLEPDEKPTIITVIESILLRHQTRRLTRTS